MINKLLDNLGEKYPLTKNPKSEFDGIKVKGMKFNIESYEAAGLGHVSTMSAKGFFGLMKMDTMIVTPKEKDQPLFSYDRIQAMGNDKLYVEFYDTCVKEPEMKEVDSLGKKYSEVPKAQPKVQWYDDIKLPETTTYVGKKKDTDKFDKIALEYMDAYKKLPSVEVTDTEAKNKRISYYVDGLLNNGGPATDVFLNAVGKEKTTELFKKVLF